MDPSLLVVGVQGESHEGAGEEAVGDEATVAVVEYKFNKSTNTVHTVFF